MSHVTSCTVLRFYAHGISRRSNPPSRASRERPVVTLLSTSLRLLPPLSLHPDSRLVRIVAYGVAALVGATPSGYASIPFHSVQPFNDASDCLSNRSSIRIPLDDLHSVPSISTAAPRQMRTRRLQINDTNFSRMLFFSPTPLCSKLSSSMSVASIFPAIQCYSFLCLPGRVLMNTTHKTSFISGFTDAKMENISRLCFA